MVSPIYDLTKIAAQFTRQGGYFCGLLLSLPNVYPILKQVKPKLTTAMKSKIFIGLALLFNGFLCRFLCNQRVNKKLHWWTQWIYFYYICVNFIRNFLKFWTHCVQSLVVPCHGRIIEFCFKKHYQRHEHGMQKKHRNLIWLFVFVNIGIMPLRMYLMKTKSG